MNFPVSLELNSLTTLFVPFVSSTRLVLKGLSAQAGSGGSRMTGHTGPRSTLPTIIPTIFGGLLVTVEDPLPFRPSIPANGNGLFRIASVSSGHCSVVVEVFPTVVLFTITGCCFLGKEKTNAIIITKRSVSTVLLKVVMNLFYHIRRTNCCA